MPRWKARRTATCGSPTSNMIDPMAERWPKHIQSSHDVACGFCGLGCDDLKVEVEGRDGPCPPASVCPEAARLLRRMDVADPPFSRLGAPCSAQEAFDEARADPSDAARAPLFAGLGTDIAGGQGAARPRRAAPAACSTTAASIGLFRNFTAIQRTGWLATTLAEVRNRCDVLLVVGNDPTPSFGRLFERLFPDTPLFAGEQRKVIFLGGAPGTRASGAARPGRGLEPAGHRSSRSARRAHRLGRRAHAARAPASAALPRPISPPSRRP